MGVGLAALVLVLAAQVAPTPNVDFARQRFQRGLTLYEQGRAEEALIEFQASVALYASPNSQLYVARCLRALGRTPEAVQQYERAVGLASDRAASDPRYHDTRRAAEEELRALEPRIARLRLNVAGLPADARVEVDGREIPRDAWGLLVPVAPGSVRVTAASADAPMLVRDVTVRAGQQTSVDLRRTAPAEVPAVQVAATGGGSPRRVLLWTSLAATGAGLASFATFYALAARQHDQLAERCGAMPCGAAEAGAIASGRRYQTLANVSLGAATAGATVAVLLWLWPSTEPGRLSLVPAPSGLLVRGEF